MRGNAPPLNVDQYLARLGEEQRAALAKLRQDIHAAAPGAEECISYQIPGFKLDGKLLVHFGAAAKHCSFYPGTQAITTHAEELAGYDTSKGTLRFPADRPLPATLVRKLVKTVIAGLDARRSAAKKRAAVKSAAARSAAKKR